MSFITPKNIERKLDMEKEKQSKQIRPLPPELLCEMHKCLPLADALDVLVEVPCRAIAKNCGNRMRRVVQQIKKSLRKYQHHLEHGEEGEEFDADKFEREMAEWRFEQMEIISEFGWSPELEAMIRFGGWMTKTRQFKTYHSTTLEGEPADFLEKFIIFVANSRSTRGLLDYLQLFFTKATFPSFLAPLFENAEAKILANGRILFESINLRIGENKIVEIRDGELHNRWPNKNTKELILHVVNKFDPQKVFQFCFVGLEESTTIGGWSMGDVQQMEFEPLKQINEKCNGNNFIREGDKLEANKKIYWTLQWDAFLRRGAAFSPFRHFKIAEEDWLMHCPVRYSDFLIGYMAQTEHPEDVLESIDLRMTIAEDLNISSVEPLLCRIRNACAEGIPEGGKLMEFGGKRLRILSSEGIEQNPFGRFDRTKFTLANGPTNGAIVFDFEVQMKFASGPYKLFIGLKMNRRKL